MLPKPSESAKIDYTTRCKCGKVALVNEDWCEDCWAEQASMWMWRGIGGNDAAGSMETTDIMDSRILGISLAAYRRRNR